MADGFLGRWARRKQEVREGRPLEEPAPRVEPARAAAPAAPLPASPASSGETASAESSGVPELSLEDVKSLTPQSDFTPFVARGVDPEVKNAAVKKLFADPHFNVMDGLDTYIDDYSKPDPLPASMLRKMASAQFLKLFDEEKGDNPVPPDKRIDPPAGAQPANPPPAEPVPAANPELTTENHANTDLRLQQDDAAGAPGSGGGPQ